MDALFCMQAKGRLIKLIVFLYRRNRPKIDNWSLLDILRTKIV